MLTFKTNTLILSYCFGSSRLCAKSLLTTMFPAIDYPDQNMCAFHPLCLAIYHNKSESLIYMTHMPLEPTTMQMMPSLYLSELCQRNKSFSRWIMKLLSVRMLSKHRGEQRNASLTSCFAICFCLPSPPLYPCDIANEQSNSSCLFPFWLQFRKSFRHIRKTEARA